MTYYVVRHDWGTRYDLKKALARELGVPAAKVNVRDRVRLGNSIAYRLSFNGIEPTYEDVDHAVVAAMKFDGCTFDDERRGSDVEARQVDAREWPS